MGYYADHADFIQPEPDANGARDLPIPAWTWKSLPKPALDSLPPRGRKWEMERYAAYQEWLAGHTMGEIFDRAASFLAEAARAAGTEVPEASEADAADAHEV
jgi:hypothetical protein